MFFKRDQRVERKSLLFVEVLVLVECWWSAGT
jgi:hypothetical protein